jgi:hypothetical protein
MTVCCKCAYWDTIYRNHYDAGAMALCNRLSAPSDVVHPSEEYVVIWPNMQEAHKDMYILTRKMFGCKFFKPVEDPKVPL